MLKVPTAIQQEIKVMSDETAFTGAFATSDAPFTFFGFENGAFQLVKTVLDNPIKFDVK